MYLNKTINSATRMSFLDAFGHWFHTRTSQYHVLSLHNLLYVPLPRLKDFSIVKLKGIVIKWKSLYRVYIYGILKVTFLLVCAGLDVSPPMPPPLAERLVIKCKMQLKWLQKYIMWLFMRKQSYASLILMLSTFSSIVHTNTALIDNTRSLLV